MKNFIKFLILTIFILSLTSCSMMLEDFKNSTKDSKYTVEHYQEIIPVYEKHDTGYIQSNLIIGEDGNLVPEFKLFESEINYGAPDSLTLAKEKNYPGFTHLAFEQKKITSDNSCVIKIFYIRNEVTITVDIGDGIWNYVQKKADSSLEEDKIPRTFTKKTGASTADDFYGLFSNSGKKTCSLTKFKLSDNNEIESLPDSFPTKDETYTAIWEEGKPANYKIVHHLERLDCTSIDDETDENYEIAENLTDILSGIPETETATQNKAKSIPGFTARPHSEKEIESNGSTVIDIYYTRNNITLTIDIGDGIWNYVQKKADSSIEEDKINRTVSGKYGSSTLEALASLFDNSGKKSCSLTKFTLTNGSEVENIPESFPPEDETYMAIWEEGQPTHYRINHHFEKVECTDSSIDSEENYELKPEYSESKHGIPEMETETQDCVKTIPGFTAKPHSEKEIAPNGSTVIDIFYVRHFNSISISTDEGLWNYDEWKLDKSIEQDNQPKTIDGKFDSQVDWTVLNKLKKLGMNLYGLKNIATGEILTINNLPEKIPVTNMNYSAVWTQKPSVPYKINFKTEKLDSIDSNNPENYVIHSFDSSKTGTPEYFTEATAKNIPGFSAMDIIQQEIKEDGTTEVDIFYKRNTYKITFDLNDGYWNYTDYKADKSNIIPDSSSKEISGKYEKDIILPDFTHIGKRASDFTGWKNLSDNKIYTIEQLSENFTKFGASDIILQGQWKKGTGIEYTVKHWFEKVDSTDSSNNENYELNNALTQTNLGEESGEDTEAVPKTVLGFTAKPFDQQTINEDKSTVVNIYYTRNSSNFIFDANGGHISSGSSEITGKYEAEFNPEDTPVAQKTNWEFAGWTYKGKLVTDSELKLINQSFEAENKTFLAYWKSVISVSSPTFFGDIILTKIQDSQKIVCTVTLPAGYENENWTYKWYVDTVYTNNDAQFSKTPAELGRGVHTITLKATMNGQNFTQSVTATVD